jgi:hypothetical protein
MNTLKGLALALLTGIIMIAIYVSGVFLGWVLTALGVVGIVLSILGTIGYCIFEALKHVFKQAVTKSDL